jgi:hypothetical protein
MVLRLENLFDNSTFPNKTSDAVGTWASFHACSCIRFLTLFKEAVLFLRTSRRNQLHLGQELVHLLCCRAVVGVMFALALLVYTLSQYHKLLTVGVLYDGSSILYLRPCRRAVVHQRT